MPIAIRWRSSFRHAALRVACVAVAIAASAVLTACGTSPPKNVATGGPGGPAVVPRAGPAGSERDGPDAQPPTDLASVPDAEPRLEPIRSGGPNKPYEVLGRDYTPITEDKPFIERGLASWYGKKFHGRRTASGEIYNMYAMTAAHPTLPIPSYVRVRNPANNREVVVRINDRGPFHPGRIVDLSYTAAFKLGVLKGVAPVELSRITFEEIRTGTWRKDGEPEALAGSSSGRELAQKRLAAAADQDAVISNPRTPAPAVMASSASSAAIVMPAPILPVMAPDDQPADRAPGRGEAAAASDSPPLRAESTAPPAATRPAPGFWVQLGVFRQREGADGFHRFVAADLDWLAPLLAVFTEPTAFRLQAGPYASREQAQDVAKRVRESLSLVPVIVERR